MFNNYLKYLDASKNKDKDYLIFSSKFCESIMDDSFTNGCENDLESITQDLLIIPRKVQNDWMVYFGIRTEENIIFIDFRLSLNINTERMRLLLISSKKEQISDGK